MHITEDPLVSAIAGKWLMYSRYKAYFVIENKVQLRIHIFGQKKKCWNNCNYDILLVLNNEAILKPRLWYGLKEIETNQNTPLKAPLDCLFS